MIAFADFSPWPVRFYRELEPGLEGRPLAVVVGKRTVALSREARAIGVREGMSADVARARSEALIIRPLPAGLEAAWDSRLFELARYTPYLEAPLPGQVFLDLAEADARLLAKTYHVPVGLARSKEDARLAAALAPEGEVHPVRDPAAFLAGLPLPALRAAGLSEESLLRLSWLGLKTAGELAGWSVPQIEAFLPEAGRLLPYLKGPKRTRVAVFDPGPRLERTLDFPEAVEPQRALEALPRLAGALEAGLEGKSAGVLLLEVEAGGLRFFAERRPKEPLRGRRRLRIHLEAALRASGALLQPVERIRATLAGLQVPGRQEGLFHRTGDLAGVFRRFPRAFVRAVITDPEALAPEHGFTYVPLEVENAPGSRSRRDRRTGHPKRGA